MTLRYANKEHTVCTFGGGTFGLAGPDDWESIVNGPTREAVKAWLAAGNTPEPFQPPGFAEERETFLNEVRLTREAILNRLAGIASAAIITGDSSLQQAFVKARQALLGITTDAGVLAAKDLPTLKLAVVTVYKGIVAASPPAIVDAFNLVDE